MEDDNLCLLPDDMAVILLCGYLCLSGFKGS